MTRHSIVFGLDRSICDDYYYYYVNTLQVVTVCHCIQSDTMRSFCFKISVDRQTDLFAQSNGKRPKCSFFIGLTVRHILSHDTHLATMRVLTVLRHWVTKHPEVRTHCFKLLLDFSRRRHFRSRAQFYCFEKNTLCLIAHGGQHLGQIN